jgi:quinol monooxygenase YgiN
VAAPPAASIVVHNELHIRPERMTELRALLNPDQTRNYPGCVSFEIFEDVDVPGRVVFLQEWESRDSLEAYRAWRAGNGSRAQLRELYSAPARTSYLTRQG